MSVQSTAQSYKRPGLKINLGRTCTLPKFDETKTQSNTSTASSTQTSSSKSSNSVKYTALSALGNTSRQTIYRDGSPYASGTAGSAPYVGGKRNINPNDFKLHNVTANLDVSIANGFAPTARSARRQEARFNAELQKYVQYMNAQNAYANGRSNKAEGIMSTISMLNQTIGSVTKAVASTKASNPSSITSSSSNNSSIQFAGNTSKEYDSKVQTEKALKDSATELSASLDANIKENTEILNNKNTDLSNVKVAISNLNQQINALKSTLGKDPANAALTEGRIKELEVKLKAKQEEQKNLETEIKNLNDSITNDTKDKAQKDKEVSQHEANIASYQSAQTKLEKSEQRNLNSSYEKLKKLAGKAEKETNETKKQELIKEYKGIATTYNALVANTTVKGFTPVSEEPNFVDAKGLLAQSGF